MNKNLYFENQAIKWGKFFKVPNLNIRHSTKLKNYTAMAYRWYEGNKKCSEIIYAPIFIEDLSKREIIHFVLHELGHVIYRRTRIKWKREYEAEKFAPGNY